MHNNNFAHRDLKLENLLLVYKEGDQKLDVKIADFGLALKFETGVGMDE